MRPKPSFARRIVIAFVLLTILVSVLFGFKMDLPKADSTKAAAVGDKIEAKKA